MSMSIQRPLHGLLTIFIAAAAATACDEDQIVPRAEYQRPTGLTFIERAVSITCPVTPLLDPAGFAALEEAASDLDPDDRAGLLGGVARVDAYEDALSGRRLGMLMVADSEAEGVRVTQYEQFVTTSSLSSEVEISTDSEIVPGPVVFFPLVLSTPGFPTRVAAGKDEVIITAQCPYSAFGGTFTFTSSITRVEPRAARSFVLSNLGGQAGASAAISIIDSRPRALEARADAYLGFQLGSIDLGAISATAGPFTSIDLQSIAYTGCEPITVNDALVAPNPCDDTGTDVLALLQDPIGNEDARLVFMSISRDRFERSFVPVRLPAPAHPGGMVVFEDRVVISNAAGPDVFEVPFTLTGTVVVPGAVRRIDVGGPTSAIFDGGPMGVFASRLDVPRLVQLVDRGGRLVHGDEPLVSLFEYDADPGNPERLGQLDMRNSPIVAARLGRVDQLELTIAGDGVLSAIDSSDFFGDRRAPALLVTFADSAVNFIVGSPPRLGLLRDDRLSVIRRLELDEEDDDVQPTEVLGCDPSNFGFEADNQTLDLDPDGPVAACTPATANVQQCESPLVIGATGISGFFSAAYRGPVFVAETGTLQTQVTEGAPFTVSGIDPSGFPIRAGDSVLFQTVPIEESDCSLAVVEGSVTATTADSVSFMPTEGRDFAQSCGNLEVGWFEVYPSGPEAVFSRTIQARPVLVLQREPVSFMSSSAHTATTSRAFFVEFSGPSLDGEELPFEFQLQGATVFEDPETGELAQATDGRLCFVDTDCSLGLDCLPGFFTTENDDANVLRRCSDRCTCPDGATCDERRLLRSGVEITVSGSPIVGLQLSTNVTGGQTGNQLGLPEDVIFAPMLRSWLISVPGSRALAQVFPTVGTIILNVTR